MRVTHGMLADTTLRNLNANTRRLDRLQNQLTTGRRIHKASDDPIAMARALTYRTDLAETAQYLRNVDAATSWLNATDAALGSVTSLLQRARELAVQGASDSGSAQDRLTIANEVRQILEGAIQVGNGKLGADHLFSGQRTDTPPFTYDAATLTWTYNGDAGQITREIGPGAQVDVNVSGDTVLDPAFAALKDLILGLEANDRAAVDASLAQLDLAVDGILVARSRTGARANRLEATADRLGDLEVNQTELLSKQEDLDLAEALMEFAVAENVYKAALAAGSRAIQPSLLDYLR